MNTTPIEQLGIELSVEEIIPRKRCAMCHEFLPITIFHLNKNGKYGRGSHCRPCRKRYNQQKDVIQRRRVHRQQNREYFRQVDREFRSRHRDQRKANNKSYKQAHKAEIDAYRKTPKAKAAVRLGKIRWRTRNANAKGRFTIDQFFARCEFYGWCCYLCRKPLTFDTVAIEHRIPLSRGGTNWPANLAPSCRSCNSKKCNKTEIEYRAELKKSIGVTS